MLQTVRVSVEGNQPVEPKAFIFVQSKLQRGDLEAIEYIDAEERAAAAVELFRDVLQFKPENVVMCRDYTKAQVIELFEKLHSEAELFENDIKNGSRNVNAIYVNWIGFTLHSGDHPIMKNFYFRMIEGFQKFHLTKSGEPIALNELSLRICQMSKTQIFLLVDDQ